VDFVAVVDQVIALLRPRGCGTYCTLKQQFQLDMAAADAESHAALVSLVRPSLGAVHRGHRRASA
jgi:hypothetical protein